MELCSTDKICSPATLGFPSCSCGDNFNSYKSLAAYRAWPETGTHSIQRIHLKGLSGCKIHKIGLATWYESLIGELQSNASGLVRHNMCRVFSLFDRLILRIIVLRMWVLDSIKRDLTDYNRAIAELNVLSGG